MTQARNQASRAGRQTEMMTTDQQTDKQTSRQSMQIDAGKRRKVGTKIER